MALFQRSYKDNLRALKREMESKERAAPEVKQPVGPFDEYVFGLSMDSFAPMKNAHLYKKAFAAIKHSYELPMPENITHIQRETNVFADVTTFLPPILAKPDEVPLIDGDFLTGYYLAKFHFGLSKQLVSFHAGISSDQLLRGIYYYHSKKIGSKWQLYGCDKYPIGKYKNLYTNGIKPRCDVFDSNTALQINVQLSEKISGKLSLYTSDIAVKSFADFLKTYLLVVEHVEDTGVILLRMPINWQKYYTAMSTLLIWFMSRYNTVKVFKTPWNLHPKYYLILKDLKEPLADSTITMLKTYSALSLPVFPPLISQIFFDTEDNESTQVKQLVDAAYIHMMCKEVPITANEATAKWAEIVG